MLKQVMSEEQKQARKEYQKQWREANKKRLAEWYREYRKKNPEVNRQNTKKYRENNPEKAKEISRKYKAANRDKANAYRIKYRQRRYELEAKRRKEDPLFSLKENVRRAVAKAFKRNGFSKNCKTLSILGCSFEEFKTYLESKFESWMTWENRGLYNGELNYGWDIDHIIPISSATTEEEVIKLSHYTNLQPLCSKINRDIKRNNHIK